MVGLWLKKFGMCSFYCSDLENPWHVNTLKDLIHPAIKKIKGHVSLEFSKGILPWNPFTLRIHHSVKEDWGSLAHSLGTPGLLAPVVGPRPSRQAPASLVSPPFMLYVNLLFQPHITTHVSSGA